MWFHDHILSIVMFFPLLGAAITLLLPSGSKDLIRLWANVVGFIGFLISLPLVMWFDADRDGFQFVERATWIPSIGANYALGIDGISLLLIMLTTATASSLSRELRGSLPSARITRSGSM